MQETLYNVLALCCTQSIVVCPLMHAVGLNPASKCVFKGKFCDDITPEDWKNYYDSLKHKGADRA